MCVAAVKRHCPTHAMRAPPHCLRHRYARRICNVYEFLDYHHRGILKHEARARCQDRAQRVGRYGVAARNLYPAYLMFYEVDVFAWHSLNLLQFVDSVTLGANVPSVIAE